MGLRENIQSKVVDGCIDLGVLGRLQIGLNDLLAIEVIEGLISLYPDASYNSIVNMVISPRFEVASRSVVEELGESFNDFVMNCIWWTTTLASIKA